MFFVTLYSSQGRDIVSSQTISSEVGVLCVCGGGSVEIWNRARGAEVTSV